MAMNKRILFSLLIILSFLAGAVVDIDFSDSDFSHVVTIGQNDVVYASGDPDYTCYGVNDHIQFQAALNGLNSSGGEIDILNGDYVFGGTVSRAIDNVTINGVGASVSITNNGSTALFSAGSQDSWVFCDLTTDAGGITVSSATNCTKVNVTEGSTYYAYWTSEDITADEWATPTGRTAKYVVAASDASDEAKAQADYLCNGTDDDVEIQAALDSLSSGGSVALTDGTFNISSSLEFSYDDVWLYGQGNVTKLFLVDGTNDDVIKTVDNIAYVKLSDFMIDGNSAGQTGGVGIDFYNGGLVNYLTIKDLYIYDCSGHGCWLAGGYGRVSDVVSEGNGGNGFRYRGFGKSLSNNLYSYNNGTNTSGSALNRCGFFFRAVGKAEMMGLVAEYNGQGGGATPGYGIGTYQLQNSYLQALLVDNGAAGIVLGGGGTDETNSGYNELHITGYDQVVSLIDLGNDQLGHNTVFVNADGQNATGSNGVYTPCDYNVIRGVIKNMAFEGVMIAGKYNDVSVTAVNNGQSASRACGVLMAGFEGNDSQYNNIHDCILGDDQGTATQDYGIGVSASGQTVNNNEFINNRLFGNDTAPIQTVDITDTVEGNIGYIAAGERRSASGSLTGGAQNAILFSWHNPEAQDILIRKVVINITTADASAANIDCGIADDASYTNGGTEFFDDLKGETVQVNDSWSTAEGQQSLWVLCQDSASATDGWVVAKILDNDGSDIAGSYYIEYAGK